VKIRNKLFNFQTTYNSESRTQEIYDRSPPNDKVVAVLKYPLKKLNEQRNQASDPNKFPNSPGV
jgi:hypothetical protein